MAREQFEEDRDRAEAQRMVADAEMEALKKQLARDVKSGLAPAPTFEADYAENRLAARELQVTAKRYVTSDATVEKLGELLQENARGILLVRDELSGWMRTFDKPGREGEREFYLEAWNGNGSYTFDRISRGTVHIPAMTLSVLGSIQPGKLAVVVRGALSNGEGADGLLQRLQLVVYPDALGPWKKLDRWPDAEAKSRA